MSAPIATAATHLGSMGTITFGLKNSTHGASHLTACLPAPYARQGKPTLKAGSEKSCIFFCHSPRLV